MSGVLLGRGMGTYGDDGIFAFDSYHQFLFLDLDDEVSTFEVSRDFHGDVEIPDLLRPFVGEGCLFFGLLCSSCCFFRRGWFCDWRVRLSLEVQGELLGRTWRVARGNQGKQRGLPIGMASGGYGIEITYL